MPFKQALPTEPSAPFDTISGILDAQNGDSLRCHASTKQTWTNWQANTERGKAGADTVSVVLA